MSPYVAALLRINAPGEGSAPATIGGTSTAAVALPSASKIWIKASQRCHVIFGAAGVAAATTSSIPLTADVDYVLDIPVGVTHYRALRSGSTDAVLSVVGVD